MITILGMAHVGIRVSDFSRTVAFYRQLGFNVIREDLDERVIVVRHASGVELNLLDSVDSPGSARNLLMDEPVRYPGYTHIALRLADIRQAARHIKQLGIAITEGPVTFGDGSTSIFFRDPDRNVIEFTQPATLNHQLDDVVTEGL
jgi:lactoylglutathione lyase